MYFPRYLEATTKSKIKDRASERINKDNIINGEEGWKQVWLVFAIGSSSIST